MVVDWWWLFIDVANESDTPSRRSLCTHRSKNEIKFLAFLNLYVKISNHVIVWQDKISKALYHLPHTQDCLLLYIVRMCIDRVRWFSLTMTDHGGVR